jgi:Cu(I)/Ag(I) efflux system membrane fusion protein
MGRGRVETIPILWRIAMSEIPASGRPHNFLWKVWLIVRVAQARLRFIALLALVGAILIYWDTLWALYDKWTRPAAASATATAGFEYWCPMHPSIVRDHEDTCPLCHMPLAKRAVGEKQPLPPGVVQRVQLSPYRVTLAGIRTWTVGYQEMFKEIRTVGFVEWDERKLYQIACRLPGQTRIDKLYVNFTGAEVRAGEPLVQLFNQELVVTEQNLLDAHRAGKADLEQGARERLSLWGIDPEQINAILKAGKTQTQVVLRAPLGKIPSEHGYFHVVRKYNIEGSYVSEGMPLFDLADLSTVWIEAQVYEDERAFLKQDLPVTAAIKAYPNRVFQGKVAFVYPHLDAASRTLKVRFTMDNPNHEFRPGDYAMVSLKVPAAEAAQAYFEERLQNQAIVEGLLPVRAGLFAAWRRQGASWLERGVDEALHANNYLLAVPETAVIDTGTAKFVFRESEPNVFDAVPVELGPRSGTFYPVYSGLQAGDQVVFQGSFLIDAETRLNAGATAVYFGTEGGHRGGAVLPSGGEDEEQRIRAAFSKLSRADRALAGEQEYCPVLQQSRLGSMGPPFKLILENETVFLCCQSCANDARSHAREVAAKARALRARKKAGK